MNLIDIEIGILEISFIIVIILCIWLAVREIRCWYWKINALLDEQKKQTQILDSILYYFEEMNQEQEQENDELQPKSTP